MGVLVLGEAAGIGCANWVLRGIVSDVASVLSKTGADELAAWLMGEDSPVGLYGDLDVRDLTPDNARAFRDAVVVAIREVRERGPIGWHDPAAWPGYLRLFGSLAEQAEQLARGETPTVLPNLSSVPAHDGTKDGPGWPLTDPTFARRR